MNMKRSSWWQLGLVACAAMLASCGGAEVAEEAAAPEPSVSLLEEAIEQRGEPCTCVSENLEAMSGLLGRLQLRRVCFSSWRNRAAALPVGQI